MTGIFVCLSQALFPRRLHLVSAQPSPTICFLAMASFLEISTLPFSQRSFSTSHQSLPCPRWKSYFSKHCSSGDRSKRCSVPLEAL